MCVTQERSTDCDNTDCPVLTEEQKVQLSELQLFKNKEGTVAIEASKVSSNSMMKHDV